MPGRRWHDRQSGSVGVLPGDAIRSNGGVLEDRQRSEIMHQSIAGRLSSSGFGGCGKEKAKAQSLLCKRRKLTSVPRTHSFPPALELFHINTDVLFSNL